MKYNTISTTSLSSENKKSTLTIYTDTELSPEKLSRSEAEIKSIRDELEMVQRALCLQTRRCRQLVTEYTKRLQQKEQQYQSEKQLRDNQLANVLRALLIFEARLKQEQKYITHQLKRKDYVIRKQKHEINKLLASQYCKHCNQSSSPISHIESIEDSSLEYAGTGDYQSSNLESLDSSSETYATLSEKDYCVKRTPDFTFSGDENSRSESGSLYQKNKNSFGRKGKKLGHRKSVGTYFEVLKMRSDNFSPSSNGDYTSNDFENMDSLPPDSITDKISVVSERIENILSSGNEDNDKEVNNKENNDVYDLSSNVSESDCNNTVIQKVENEEEQNQTVNNSIESEKISKITESIPVFDDDEERNDNWYASASDQEDDDQRDMYRNNPVLECMNQILLQNINDTLNSPPKTPTVERKSLKTKRVKFCDEEECKEENENKQVVNNDEKGSIDVNMSEPSYQPNYYETPVQKQQNYYETPQSIYSNDYEQILSSKGSNSNFPTIDNNVSQEGNKLHNDLNPSDNKDHYYIDMETKEEKDNTKIVRKSKILRTPPALPPKPSNLVSKYKIQNLTAGNIIKNKEIVNDLESVESEPDYCSISELNLPTNKMIKPTLKKINVVAEINPQQLAESSAISETQIILHKPKVTESSNSSNSSSSHYDLVDVNSCIPKLVVSKNIEKFNIQIAKQASTKLDSITGPTSPKKKIEPEIPKLPQVTEIIIPEENEPEKIEPERITQDNYVKNNSQVLKLELKKNCQTPRRPIVIGTSVSSLITGFNNQKILSDVGQKQKRFTSFENLQSLEKPSTKQEGPESKYETFDLSQNFEEFKLDDCEIGEEYNIDLPDLVIKEVKQPKETLVNEPTSPIKNSTRVEVVRATNNVQIPQLNNNSIQQLKKQLELQKSKNSFEKQLKSDENASSNEPTYEHFLECTGLSSKSILTPSRLLSNHKSVLKPKDVKLRSKVKSTVFERQGSTIKYWSEPYI